ncbi:histone deacetylase [Curvibacter sp. APW13]|uniref:histone deacetylase family protein n=1 Tax=Curvibacter sp. APW13 TaxID=3077236 RepID=UPI0028DF77F9|nr:histone deacetylase [Curvibacter sp. APW13]MDT8991991.1 histone deacetylase [Curvibacter sp. APW13]
MQVFYATQFVLPLPSGHRFPMEKYRMLRDALADMPQVRLGQAEPAQDHELELVHTPLYVQGIDHGTLAASVYREIGFPWSPAMAERARRSVGASLSAARSAQREGLAANIAGGTHHAYADKGGGFCVFNDFAVAARTLQYAHVQQGGQAPLPIAIIDLDVHQGNGTARIFQGDASVFTLSLHGEKNFPFRKEASTLDLGLPDGAGDAEYLETLEHALSELERRFAPALVLYLAGADPHEGDRLGRLKLTFDGLMARDRRVFDWCWQRRIPCAFAMGGGYGHTLETTVQVQVNTYRIALEYWERWQRRRGGGTPAGKA